MDTQTDGSRRQYGLFAVDEQDPAEFYVLIGRPVEVEYAGQTRDEIHDIVFERVVSGDSMWTDVPQQETFIAEVGEFPGGEQTS